VIINSLSLPPSPREKSKEEVLAEGEGKKSPFNTKGDRAFHPLETAARLEKVKKK